MLVGSTSDFAPESETTDIMSDQLGKIMLNLAEEETSEKQVSVPAGTASGWTVDVAREDDST